MTEQAYQQTVQAHQDRQCTIQEDLQRLIEESREIARQLQQLQADRMNPQRQKATVQNGE